jgi:hypothetical protein
MSCLGNDLLEPERPASPMMMRVVSMSMSSRVWMSEREKGVMQKG